MGKKEQVPALAIFVQGFLCVCGRRLAGVVLPGGGLALAVFHMVPRVPAAPDLFVHPPADLRKVLLRLPRLALRVCSASPSSALRRLTSGDGSSIVRRTVCVRGTLKKWVLYVTLFEKIVPSWP